MLKPDIIVHWTGKELHPKDENKNPIVMLDDVDESMLDNYISLLKGILANGLFLTKYDEEIAGGGNVNITRDSRVLCFTDLGIRNSDFHVTKYGLMGLGFSRKDILEKDGRPVWYIRNHHNDLHGMLLYKIATYLLEHKDESHKLNELYLELSLMLDNIKPMSKTDFDNFEFLEENEWRIAYNSDLPKIGNLKKRSGFENEFNMPINPNDLKLLVLPNKRCRKMLQEDTEIMKFINSGTESPLILSLEEFEQM